jgi:protein TonB
VLSAHGFGIEEEALRLLKTTGNGDGWKKATEGKWVPAIQNGRSVRSYRKQPITFFVEE